MADVINKYQGTIDEFMGDGILVLFGVPLHLGSPKTHQALLRLYESRFSQE